MINLVDAVAAAAKSVSKRRFEWFEKPATYQYQAIKIVGKKVQENSTTALISYSRNVDDISIYDSDNSCCCSATITFMKLFFDWQSNS